MWDKGIQIYLDAKRLSAPVPSSNVCTPKTRFKQLHDKRSIVQNHHYASNCSNDLTNRISQNEQFQRLAENFHSNSISGTFFGGNQLETKRFARVEILVVERAGR